MRAKLANLQCQQDQVEAVVERICERIQVWSLYIQKNTPIEMKTHVGAVLLSLHLTVRRLHSAAIPHSLTT